MAKFVIESVWAIILAILSSAFLNAQGADELRSGVSIRRLDQDSTAHLIQWIVDESNAKGALFDPEIQVWKLFLKGKSLVPGMTLMRGSQILARASNDSPTIIIELQMKDRLNYFEISATDKKNRLWIERFEATLTTAQVSFKKDTGRDSLRVGLWGESFRYLETGKKNYSKTGLLLSLGYSFRRPKGSVKLLGDLNVGGLVLQSNQKKFKAIDVFGKIAIALLLNSPQSRLLWIPSFGLGYSDLFVLPNGFGYSKLIYPVASMQVILVLAKNKGFVLEPSLGLIGQSFSQGISQRDFNTKFGYSFGNEKGSKWTLGLYYGQIAFKPLKNYSMQSSTLMAGLSYQSVTQFFW